MPDHYRYLLEQASNRRRRVRHKNDVHLSFAPISFIVSRYCVTSIITSLGVEPSTAFENASTESLSPTALTAAG
jgi:long-subunit acyl-CoA synthetase (AMP-forming)